MPSTLPDGDETTDAAPTSDAQGLADLVAEQVEPVLLVPPLGVREREQDRALLTGAARGTGGEEVTSSGTGSA